MNNERERGKRNNHICKEKDNRKRFSMDHKTKSFGHAAISMCIIILFSLLFTYDMWELALGLILIYIAGKVSQTVLGVSYRDEKEKAKENDFFTSKHLDTGYHLIHCGIGGFAVLLILCFLFAITYAYGDPAFMKHFTDYFVVVGIGSTIALVAGLFLTRWLKQRI